MTPSLKLHHVALSGHAHRARLMLSLLGLPHQLVEVDLRQGEHKRPASTAPACPAWHTGMNVATVVSTTTASSGRGPGPPAASASSVRFAAFTTCV